MIKNIPEIFGTQVFNDAVMQKCLSPEVYEALKKTVQDGMPMEKEVAQAIANAMKDWAMEKGATHFTHWFQPMTGITAEKHESFIFPNGQGQVITEFSGKELVKGESDASSFPSGGLRATFEARGYTTWDPTSYAFVKDGSLYIPTAFRSYSGEVLDQKTPLLRSMQAINKQTLRVLKLLGFSPAHVTTTVGPEQEYFLIDKALYSKRKDLIFTGRTLFGAKPPKGQELEDHYYGNIKERIGLFMKELDEELWKLGVYAKTKHNEVAPAQHELAQVFSTTNVSADQNQLTMEMMKKIANRHGLVCLLHEKPFDGVNGSGKHNNWSIGTDSGENLLDPTKEPENNPRFLLFLVAIMKGVDRYGDLLRACVATAGNDLRLGGNEAPPAIISMYLGDHLVQVLESIEKGKPCERRHRLILQSGVDSMPILRQDTADRNRTSPFAFTGNKFEFRMPGSSQSISGINVVLNTIVADSLSEFAERLEKAKNPAEEAWHIIKEVYCEHKRIIFNGNNYAAEWVAEAEKRGLPNLKSTVDALPSYVDPKNIALFKKHGIFTESELHARYEIILEGYSKTIHIEALTMLEMAQREIRPACMAYTKEVMETLQLKKKSGLSLPCGKEDALCMKLCALTEALSGHIDTLKEGLCAVKGVHDALAAATCYKEKILPAMTALRSVSDELEQIVSRDYWPFPTYSDLLFNI